MANFRTSHSFLLCCFPGGQFPCVCVLLLLRSFVYSLTCRLLSFCLVFLIGLSSLCIFYVYLCCLFLYLNGACLIVCFLSAFARLCVNVSSLHNTDFGFLSFFVCFLFTSLSERGGWGGGGGEGGGRDREREIRYHFLFPMVFDNRWLAFFPLFFFLTSRPHPLRGLHFYI